MKNLVTSLTLQVGELQTELSVTKDRLDEAEKAKMDHENGSLYDRHSEINGNGTSDPSQLQTELEEVKKEGARLLDQLEALKVENFEATDKLSQSQAKLVFDCGGGTGQGCGLLTQK